MNKKGNVLIIVLAIVVLVVISGGAWFFILRNKGDSSPVDSGQNNNLNINTGISNKKDGKQEIKNILDKATNEYTVKYNIDYGSTSGLMQSSAGIYTWYVKGDDLRIDAIMKVGQVQMISKTYYTNGKYIVCSKLSAGGKETCSDYSNTTAPQEKSEIKITKDLKNNLDIYDISKSSGKKILNENTNCFNLIATSGQAKGTTSEFCLTSDGIILFMKYSFPNSATGAGFNLDLIQMAIDLKRSVDSSVFVLPK